MRSATAKVGCLFIGALALCAFVYLRSPERIGSANPSGGVSNQAAETTALSRPEKSATSLVAEDLYQPIQTSSQNLPQELQSRVNPSLLSQNEKAQIVTLTGQLLAATEADLGRVTSLREYAINLQARAKLMKVFERLQGDDYRILASEEEERRLTAETMDRAALVLQAPAGPRVLMAFVRGVDHDVFHVIDDSAAVLQEQWNAEAEAFNDLSSAERTRRIQMDAQARTEFTRITQDIGRSREASEAKSIAAWDEKMSEVRACHERMLPFYLVVRRGTNTVAARRSIGR